MDERNFKLKNGLTVVVSNVGSELSMSLTVNVGHVNEPNLGMAGLFEQVLTREFAGVQAVYGGTITSYLTGCRCATSQLETTMEKLAQLAKFRDFRQEVVDDVANDIAEHTRDRAPLPDRQMRLLYKHTAFGNANKVWDADVYISAVQSYDAEDLRCFADTFLTGKNIVFAISGVGMEDKIGYIKELAEKFFGDIPAGRKRKVYNEFYTGGFAKMHAPDEYRQVMLGWDVSNLHNAAEANVMMSMLKGRLERAFIGMNVDLEVKIAGYYGLRTLRVSVASRQEDDVDKFTDIICYNVHRLRTELASDRRMETSRNCAMAEKLFMFSQPQDRSVEISWQVLGRGEMYDINERINATWRVTARDVRDISEDIFSKPLTYVVYARQKCYSYAEVQSKL